MMTPLQMVKILVFKRLSQVFERVILQKVLSLRLLADFWPFVRRKIRRRHLQSIGRHEAQMMAQLLRVRGDGLRQELSFGLNDITVYAGTKALRVKAGDSFGQVFKGKRRGLV